MRTNRLIPFCLAAAGIGGLAISQQPDLPAQAGHSIAQGAQQLADASLVPSQPLSAPAGAPRRQVSVALASLDVSAPATTPAPAAPAAPPPTVVTIPAQPILPPPTTTTTTPPPAPAASGGYAGGVWAELRWCESRDNYSDDTGNGYYGAYQFSLSTWHSLGYGGLPSSASAATQDAAAQRLQARSGWGQWPACSRALGL